MSAPTDDEIKRVAAAMKAVDRRLSKARYALRPPRPPYEDYRNQVLEAQARAAIEAMRKT